MEILGVIPARAGSKGLINKNVMDFNGHPLIAYSIKAALDSKLISRVVVSTDSSDIAEIAKKYGADVPFIRPEEYASDDSRDLVVFTHCLTWLRENENYNPNIVVHLRPTSPLRMVGLVDNAIQSFLSSEYDSLRVVTESPITPYKLWRLNEVDDRIIPLLGLDGVKEPYNEPRQSLPKTFWQVGTLDVIRSEVIMNRQSMSGNSVMPFFIDPIHSIDIDTLDSFRLAEITLPKENYVKF